MFKSIASIASKAGAASGPLKSGTSMIRRTFSTTPNPLQGKEPISPFVAMIGGGVLMGGTYFALNSLFNSPSQPVAGFKTISDGAHAYLYGTYKYVLVGLTTTGAAATMAYRTGFAHRILLANPWVAMLGSLALTMGGMVATQMTDPSNVLLKHTLFLGTTASFGAVSLCTLGFFPQALLMRAGLYTFGIVSSLSLVAMNARNDAFLYIGGPLMMGLGAVFVASLVSSFAPAGGRMFMVSNAISLYGGLGLFSAFMLYDTQRIMMKGRLNTNPRPDYINESFALYLNIINIFVRMVQVLASTNSNKRR